MKALWAGDWINPIVVKELRQAVQSKFVVAVLLLFLLVQLSILGIYLVVTTTRFDPSAPEYYQAGGPVFGILQGILLGTCLLFIPLYTGFRLAAERSDTNVDLLFITTLPPRAVVWGKLGAALVLAGLIVSACAPFMAFAYLLRGLDMPSILLALGLDLLAVLAAAQLAIFVALIPTNRVFKALLGLLAFAGLVLLFWRTLAGTLAAAERGSATVTGFWAGLGCLVLGALAVVGLFFAWSVALLNPPSANRALGVRLYLLAAWLATGAGCGAGSWLLRDGVPMVYWVAGMGVVAGLAVVCAVNERESWGPRVARAIPRRWWLRGPAFLLYSGAAGGVAFGVLLFGLTALATRVWIDRALPHVGQPAFPWQARMFEDMLRALVLGGLYVLSYALTAVLVRRFSPWPIPALYTWVVMVVLVVVGSVLPFLVDFLLFFRDWRFEDQYPWLLTVPVAGFAAIGDERCRHFAWVFYAFAGSWAAAAALLNGPWFIRQLLRFRPRAGGAAAPAPDAPTLAAFAPPGAATRAADAR